MGRPFVIVTQGILVQCGLESLKEHIVVDGLSQKRMCPALNRASSDQWIRARGHDDHWHGRTYCLEPLEQFQAGDAGHSNIGDETVEPTGCIGRQEGFGPVEDVTRATQDLKEVGYGITDGLIVIDDRNQGRIEQAAGLCCCGPSGRLPKLWLN
jgi:hypothetical protein